MDPFTLRLAAGNQVAGLLSLPLKPTDAPKGFPLVIMIHGGTYTASYFDADATHSISIPAKALSIPVIALTRPGYGDSTPLPPLEDGETWIQQSGTYIHEFVLPAIWREYGKRSGASSMVLYGHSIGGAIAVVATACHNRSPDTAGYPLSGLVTSGIGALSSVPVTKYDASEAERTSTMGQMDTYEPQPGVAAPSLTWPREEKDALMLRPQDHLCDPKLLEGTTAGLNHPMSLAEVTDVRRQWPEYWLGYATDVTVPHMYALGSEDILWPPVKQSVDAFVAGFTSCVQMEVLTIRLAPHCIELSYLGQSWMVRMLGFAGECAVLDALQKERKAGGQL